MIDSIGKSDCTGCKMCADICPKDAISFEIDNQGFWYPKVNSDCIRCGLCVKKCPALNEKLKEENENSQYEPEVYSAWSQNDEVRLNSTSGGVFWEIAYNFLIDGGIVAGCSYTEDWKSARHIIARNIEDLEKIKGSKYFQSDTEGIYKAVKQELICGKKVLFCGTPCQINAMKNYLGKKYEEFYTMDFICRSINSPKAFKSFVEELEEKNNSKVINVHLKDKKQGWNSLATFVQFENGSHYLGNKNEDTWVKGFIYNDLYTRESCYHCKYKTLPRINSDITIGDFWGIKDQSEYDLFSGISVVMLNNPEGKYLLDKYGNNLKIKKYDIKSVIPGNPALLKNPIKTSKQKIFFELLEKHSFSESVNICTKETLTNKNKKRMISIFAMLKKLIWLFTKSGLDTKKFIYYNYLCKNVVRKSKAKIFPYKNAILDIKGNAKLILSGDKNLNIGINKLKGSKTETHVRLEDNAVWKCNNGADLFYNTVVEVKSNALFDTNYFSANGGSVIITHKNINIGQDVMIGRNVIIYDSDFHTLYDKNGEACNSPKPVTIENHVWLTSNTIVQKGVTIGSGSVITAFTTINRDVPKNTVFGGESVGKLIKENVKWSRTTCPLD